MVPFEVIIMVSPVNPSASPLEGNKPATGSQMPRDTAGQRPAAPERPEPSRGLGNVRTPEEAINALRARLEQQLESRLGKVEGSSPLGARFEPPSAADVAGRILNFVQARLQQEADAGADPERLANLLSQARKGVEQGFGEARDQIRAMNLMTDRLASDIDDSYNRVQEGLAGLEERFLGTPPVATGGVTETRGALVASASRNTFSFEVTTAEGDRVTVRMDERQMAASSQRTVSGDNGMITSSQQVSLFSGRYEFSVEGNLNAAERSALGALFADVQKVAGRFFDGDVQGAFKAAQSLNLTGNELTSFSLNLSSSRTVTAAAYEAVSQQPSVNSQLRPLGGLARDIQSLGQQALQTGLDLPTLEDLTRRLMDDMETMRASALDGDGMPRSLMNDFLTGILQTVQPGS